MVNKAKFFMAVVFLLGGCASQSLQQASISYKTTKDYASLRIIHEHLALGMTRASVDNLLGEPDYSPIEGQYYYSSDRKEYPEDSAANRVKVPVGVVVNYRTEQGVLTDSLQTFWLGPIGE